jgi:hypothetical protein
MSRLVLLVLLSFGCSAHAQRKKEEPKNYPRGPGNEWLLFNETAKDQPHVVLLAGDEESRSEEALPMLGREFAAQFGWRCTVLASQDPINGFVDPNEPSQVPNLKAVAEADLLVMSLRHREFGDELTQHLQTHFAAGKPVLALRHSLVAFSFDQNPNRTYALWDWQSTAPGFEGGIAKPVLGTRWLENWARTSQATRLLPVDAQHPLLEGVTLPLQLKSHVIQVKLDAKHSQPILLGEVLVDQSPGAAAATGSRKNQQINDPKMPVAWTTNYKMPKGKPGRSFTTTMGSAEDLTQPPFARLIANAARWLLDKPTQAFELPKDWKPKPAGFMQFRKKARLPDMLPKPPEPAPPAPPATVKP